MVWRREKAEDEGRIGRGGGEGYERQQEDNMINWVALARGGIRRGRREVGGGIIR